MIVTRKDTYSLETVELLRELAKTLSGLQIWAIEGSKEQEALDKARKAVNVARYAITDKRKDNDEL